MKRLFSVGLGFTLLLAGCATSPKNTVYQISTIDALLAGVFDGHLSCKELVEHGDFGIGTFDRLEGEMVVLDGEVFQVKADGKVYRPKSSETTPFATVCQFDPDRSFSVDPETDYDGLKALLDKEFSNSNLFYAVKLTGTFSAMKTRSVPGQQKPYPPLSEVTKNQPEFEMSDVSGTIVGFRCPPYVEGINVTGYHLHFLSDDRTQGGHILSFMLKEGTCEVDELNLYELELPVDAEMFAETDLSQDRSTELQQVEKEVGGSSDQAAIEKFESHLKELMILSYESDSFSLKDAVDRLAGFIREEYGEEIKIIVMGEAVAEPSRFGVEHFSLYDTLAVMADIVDFRMEVFPDSVVLAPLSE